MWSTRSVAVLAFFVMIVLRRQMALSWDVVDPASNHVGWYAWSLGVTMLTWQWWTALLLRTQGERPQKIFAFMMLLVIFENAILLPERGWTRLVHGAALTPRQHEVLYLLDIVFDITQGLFLTSVAMVATRRPFTLLLAVPVVELKVFADEAVPADLPAIQTEIVTSVAILALYGLVGIALKVPMRLPRGPARSRAPGCR